MAADTKSDQPDTGKGPEDPALERFRQGARRQAIIMGIPPAAADRIVRPLPGGSPAALPGDARGPHPGVMEILVHASDTAIRDTDEESLRRKTVPEQLHAIAKEDLYLKLEQALREIWPAIEHWLAREDCLLGQIEDVAIRNPDGSVIQGQTLHPLPAERLAHIAAEPSFRRTCMYVAYYVRAVCRAHISVWAVQREARGDRRLVAPHFQISVGKQTLEEFIWSGVNTAVKLMINSLVLLYELYSAREGLQLIDRNTWSQLTNANRSFVSLFAAVGLMDFVTFDEMVEEERDPESEVFQDREGLNNWTRKAEHARLYQPFYDARYFRLLDDHKGVPRLDLDPEQFTGHLRASFGKDIMIRRCPALRVGLINQIYGWICRALLSVAGDTLAPGLADPSP